MQSITQWLTAAGVVVPLALAEINEATGVSADGNSVTGLSYNSDGSITFWLARVGPAGKGFYTTSKPTTAVQ